MLRFMLRTSLAGAAIFTGAMLAHAQTVPPAGPPAEAAPVPGDQGMSIDPPAMPGAPATPMPEDDADED
jgi:hypothetical protein